MSSIRLLTLVIVMIMTITACKNPVNQPSEDMVTAVPPDPADCRTIEHKQGETEVCGQPQRIVVLGPYILAPLLALNVQPVGYAALFEFHQGGYTNPSQQIPYLGTRITQPLANVGLASAPSIEAILKVQPDLILGAEVVSSSHYEMLSKIAPTVLLDYYDTPGSLRTIAQAVNRTEQAEQLLTQTQQQIAAVRETLSSFVEAHPQVALLNSTSDLQSIYLRNYDDFCGSLTEALGFQLIVPPGMNKDDFSRSIPISLEIIPRLNDADLVILQGSNFRELNQLDDMDRFEEYQLSELKQTWEENVIAQSLNASKARRIYFIPTYICSGLPGPIGTELYLEELKEQLLRSTDSD
ncbi:MAG: iron-siderophore ABC transporter substrate-binding protein [Symploca sp. SIO2G7]|nr:iron-siderophore ABC transporter substrate-binding protein [Symploca sp. SIO2G7]